MSQLGTGIRQCDALLCRQMSEDGRRILLDRPEECAVDEGSRAVILDLRLPSNSRKTAASALREKEDKEGSMDDEEDETDDVMKLLPSLSEEVEAASMQMRMR
ncbi:hypothetical protein A4X09_0g7304 [Tilletia walkeri]|uniref:Uncharacterized protein n=1 Tax=Tilletia walkeri TaxID=117179 RepID=A0A8X7N2D7_9BASI|nr:hypothetical protein A4X09_0g7304 [Tilletia walkeri]